MYLLLTELVEIETIGCSFVPKFDIKFFSIQRRQIPGKYHEVFNLISNLYYSTTGTFI